jgi:Sigma-70 region 2
MTIHRLPRHVTSTSQGDKSTNDREETGGTVRPKVPALHRRCSRPRRPRKVEVHGNHFRVTGGLGGMRNTPPAGFVDFVVARGPALHRTAVLLTRQEQSAEDLVQIALAKAWRSWERIDGNHEAYVRQIIVNEFASAWRRRWRGEVPTADLPEPAHADHGDGVSSRQVLMAALATLDDLRVALHEQAHLTPYPDVDSLVAGARRRVGLARRRRLAALAASTAAVLVVGGLVATTSSTHRAALQPAKAGLGNFSVNAAGAGFPELIRGMRRVTVLDAPMLARMKGAGRHRHRDRGRHRRDNDGLGRRLPRSRLQPGGGHPQGWEDPCGHL